jgi:hypothetical protein
MLRWTTSIRSWLTVIAVAATLSTTLHGAAGAGQSFEHDPLCTHQDHDGASTELVRTSPIHHHALPGVKQSCCFGLCAVAIMRCSPRVLLRTAGNSLLAAPPVFLRTGLPDGEIFRPPKLAFRV